MFQRFCRTLRILLALGTIAVLTAALPDQTAAQNYQNYGGQNQDPPGRVARIRYMQGSVSFEPSGTQDWVPAVTNRPVTIGDQLWVDANSRAELDLGSCVVRVGQNTGMSFLNLDDNTVQIQLTQGDLNIRVRRLRPNTVLEVDTPNQAFSVYQPGTYRVEASQDGNSTMVTVRQGQGQVTGAGQAYTLDAGQAGSFTGDGTNSLVGQVMDLGNPDDLDRWAQSRDAAYDRPISARYVSPDMVGYEDLDNNGTWASDPTYGNVWYPNSVPAGWAPYRDGHWAWISPWGWTWVDDEPWGYAPFHYGRWAYTRNRWGWVPGPIQSEPVYAPALVAFIGGSGFGLSISVGRGGYGPGGDVGWFPLAPREVYVPSYYATPQYVERVNTSNTVVSTTTVTNVYNNVINNNQVTNITYVNRTNPAAVTVVPQTVLRSAQPVQQAVVRVDPQRIASAPVAARPAVVPTQASVLGTANAAATHMARPPAPVMERKVVAKTPPPPPPVPFAKQEPILAKQAGKPLVPQQLQQLRPPATAAEHPQVKLVPPGKPATLARGPANPPANPNARPTPNAPPQSQAAQQQAARQRQQEVQQQAAQQQADEKARQQQAQRQAAQQQAAEKAREQQAQQPTAQQQAAERAREQQADEKARQQQTQQQPAQQQAAQQRQQQAQPQAAQQQAAEKARQQQAQQQPAQQQAAQQRQQQAQPPTAQQQAAERAREQQAQPQTAQQQAAERARQQQAQQPTAQQQAAEHARQQQAQQQAAQQAQNRPPQQQRPPNAQQPPPQRQQPQGQPQQAKPNRPQTPEEKAREEQQKREQSQPPPE